jgi:branched-chain amino acid transport system permease protein
MALWHPTQIQDRSAAWMHVWQSLRQRDLKPLVTRDLLEEHRRNPVGSDRLHSSELMLVLNFTRSLAGADKEYIYATQPHREYAIGRLSGGRSPADESDPRRFATKEEAMHVVFLQRLERFGLLDSGAVTGSSVGERP